MPHDHCCQFVHWRYIGCPLESCSVLCSCPWQPTCRQARTAVLRSMRAAAARRTGAGHGPPQLVFVDLRLTLSQRPTQRSLQRSSTPPPGRSAWAPWEVSLEVQHFASPSRWLCPAEPWHSAHIEHVVRLSTRQPFESPRNAELQNRPATKEPAKGKPSAAAAAALMQRQVLQLFVPVEDSALQVGPAVPVR